MRAGRCAAVLCAVLVCAPPATGWFLEGLVASWVVPDVQGTEAGRRRGEPERTQPLQLSEEQEDPLDLVPLRQHPATSPPTRRERRTGWGEDKLPTPTVRAIESTAPLPDQLPERDAAGDGADSLRLYRQLLMRRRADKSGSASSWKPAGGGCLQRFICEVHMQQDHELETAGDIERNMADTLKRFGLADASSQSYKYTYAAHMGRLMRDSTSGCHELFSSCPFSKQVMLELMEKLGRKANLA